MGQVTGYALDADGHGVTIDVFVAAPFDRAVDVDARWWQAGGLGLQLGAGGMKLDTPSIAALLGGALAFASPPGRASSIPAPDGARFRVADDEIDAMRTPNAQPAPVVMRFDRSLRGLEVGAPVEFRGIELGNVTAVGTEYDAARGDVTMRVTMALYPDRLGQRYRDVLGNGESEAGKALLRTLVARGLRASSCASATRSQTARMSRSTCSRMPCPSPSTRITSRSRCRPCPARSTCCAYG